MRTYVGYTPMATAESLRTVANPSAVAGGPASGVRQPMNSTAAIGGKGGGNGQAQLAFEFGSTELGGPSSAQAGPRLRLWATGAASNWFLLARDTEVLDPGKRDALTNQRIAVITAAARQPGCSGRRRSGSTGGLIRPIRQCIGMGPAFRKARSCRSVSSRKVPIMPGKTCRCQPRWDNARHAS